MISQLTIFGEEQELTDQPSFLEVSPANLFPWLESKKAKGTTVTYGRKCFELSENLRRVGLSVRTYLESCELPLMTFARTWSVLATKSGFSILKLRLSERCTGESESHLWPTPNAMDHLPARSMESMQRMATGARKGRKTLSNLREAVDPVAVDQWAKLWPTPTTRDYKTADLNPESKRFQQKTELNSAVKLWSTPNASDCRDRGNMSNPAIQRRAEMGKQLNLSMVVSENSGQLNPTWVEWLMGYETGWTDLNVSETQ